jgi:tyrosine-protein phosphatase SIW14
MKVPQAFCKYSPVLALAIISTQAFAANANVAGVPNFYQVNEHLYRGGQPSDDGFKSLAKLGVKTVIDLRLPDEHSIANEERVVKAAGMRYINVPMHGVVTPREESVSQVLKLMNADGPVFVHCRRGADRTGTVVAVYRMSHDRWGNKQAFKEAKANGFSWTQIGLKRYISSYRAPEVLATSETNPQAAISR